MTTDYTPSMEEIKSAWTYCHPDDTSWPESSFDRAIAAHDAQLRAEIAAEIRADMRDSWTSKVLHPGMARAATIAEGTKP